MQLGVDVIASNDWVVAINKPAGLPAVPGRTADLADCAWSRVAAVFADALVVHRLDMATSGVMIFARGAQAQRRLSRAFEQRQTQKRYIADVHGLVPSDRGSVDLPLIADWPNRPRQRVDTAVGKASLTHYEVLSRDKGRNLTRLALLPITGRSHQLRLHCQAIGHPIVGDPLYGLADGASRMRLHAQRLEVPDCGEDHATQARMAFECSVPLWA